MHLLFEIIVEPIRLFLETCFVLGYRLTGNFIFSVIILSIAMNIVVLPLYSEADRIADRERKAVASMKPRLDRIKKAFEGDERQMMINTLYRENGYNPVFALRGSAPLLLQIPFFIAAYSFLSGLDAIKGASFGPVADLGAPDGMLTVGGLSINLLPVLMTLVNLVSGSFYSKKTSMRDRIQSYILSLVFLILLYNSPAILTLYWTCNNIFSLIKNIIPVFVKKKDEQKEKIRVKDPVTVRILWLSGVFMFLLMGIFIPAQIMSSRYQELVYISSGSVPVDNLVNGAGVAFGVFCFWIPVYFLMVTDRSRRMISNILFAIVPVATVNSMCADRYYLSWSEYIYDWQYSSQPGIMLYLLTSLILVVTVFVLVKFRKMVPWIMTVFVTAMLILSVYFVVKMQPLAGPTYYREDSRYNSVSSVRLSQTDRNVMVIMVDRQLARYIPYIMEADPQLEEAFDGFTNYDNAIAMGDCTLVGAQSVYGGYEYSPYFMNQRPELTLREKLNESHLAMPLLFTRAGYSAAVYDLSFDNYDWISDISIYDEYGIEVHHTGNAYNDTEKAEQEIRLLYSLSTKNLFRLSLSYVLPPFMQTFVCDEGYYLASESITYGDHRASTFMRDLDFHDCYAALTAMPERTEAYSGEGSFILMSNKTPHQLSAWDGFDYDRCAYDELGLEDPARMLMYQSSAATIDALADYMRFLQDAGLYDNTRIIIASDHGGHLNYDNLDDGLDPDCYRCTLMVKDFDSSDPYTVSHEHMSNADVPTIAMNGLIEDQTNPFTGNPMDRSLYGDGPLIVYRTDYSNPSSNPGNVFERGSWYEFSGDVYDPESWTYLYSDSDKLF